MRYILLPLISLCLFGCGKKQTDTTPPAVREFLTEFNAGQKELINEYGVSAVQSNQQNIRNTDCMVFEQTAKKSLPRTLGDAAAYQESMRLRAILGCGPSVVEALTHYETARRNTLRLWTDTLNKQVPSLQIVLKSTAAGASIEKQTMAVLSEDMACRAERGFESRKDTRSSITIEKAARACQPEPVSSGVQDEVCRYSWYTAEGQKRASGERDTLSYMSELAGRYHLMFMQCSPQASAEYVAFHKTVPSALFNGPAYRFRVPIDPIMACHIHEMAERRAERRTSRAMHSYRLCAQKFKLEYTTINTKMPAIFTPGMLLGGEPYRWIYDPTRSVEDPLRWSFGECEKNLIGYLGKYQFHIVEPEGLKNFCNNQAHK